MKFIESSEAKFVWAVITLSVWASLLLTIWLAVADGAMRWLWLSVFWLVVLVILAAMPGMKRSR